MSNNDFSCFQVSRDENGGLRHAINTVSQEALPEGEVTIRVEWSSLNYKDVLAAQAHPGVAGKLPHVPGIDAAGTVETSSDDRYSPGDVVVVTGYELGAPAWGGWSELIRVPAEWVVPMPSSLDPRSAMVIGTAGFTAAQCVRELQIAGIVEGSVLVTGASGGVGSLAVRLLAQLGYDVHAVSGKAAVRDQLIGLGASEVHTRDVLEDRPGRPLLKSIWHAGVDTVGGSLLAALLKSTKIGGCVAACGLVAGDQLQLTVYPFILRGVKLAGVTSASCPREIREWVWDKLNSDWQLDLPDDMVHEVQLADVAQTIAQMRAGEHVGRTIIRVARS